MKRGKLIVFEGISGTGKETQATLLNKYFNKRGISSRIVYHPSPQLKEILIVWRKNRHIDNVSEAYFLLADRYNMVKQIIEPALSNGEWVISLRNWVSALVYQAKTYGERTHLEKEFFRFEPTPDYLFYFDIDPAMAYARAVDRHQKTGEPMGTFETRELLLLMQKRYKEVLTKIPHVTIDASGSIDRVHYEIVKFLN